MRNRGRLSRTDGDDLISIEGGKEKGERGFDGTLD